MRLALGIMGLALLAAPAAAHDQWLNGEQVDPVLRLRCWGSNETKVVDTLVRLSADGKSIYFIDQPGNVIPLHEFSRLLMATGRSQSRIARKRR
jgi:hypothetical protein